MTSFLFTLVASTAVLWAYWPAFSAMAYRWAVNEEYSHGWLVPLFALYLLYIRKDLLNSKPPGTMGKGGLAALAIGALGWIADSKMDSLGTFGWAGMALAVVGFSAFVAEVWNGSELAREAGGNGAAWGLPLILLAAALRLFASYFNTEAVDHFSLLPLCLGLAIAAGGMAAATWVWPSIGYLIFMLPLPFQLEVALRHPLRQFATVVSTYLLQTMGLPAYSEGHSVLVNEVKLDIVEACSGLSMLMIFFALSIAVALLSDRPLWQRGMIILSAVPIALVSNIGRILVQGLLHVYGYHDAATWFHDDGSAWFMMGLALLLMMFELWYLDRLFIVDLKQPMEFGLAGKSGKSGEGRTVIPSLTP